MDEIAVPKPIYPLPDPNQQVPSVASSIFQKYPISYHDYIQYKGTLISKENYATNTTTTIYTVPADSNFYLIAANANYVLNGNSGINVGELTVSGNNVSASLLVLRTSVNAQGDFTTAMPYDYIKFLPGTKFKIVSNTTSMAFYGLITGFEIKVADELNFFT